MLEPSRVWGASVFGAKVRVRYQRESLDAVQGKLPPPPPAWKKPGAAFTYRRLLGHPGGESRRLEEWTAGPGCDGVTPWACEEAFSATRQTWRVLRHSGRGGGVAHPHDRVGAWKREPNWPLDGEILTTPHFRETVDPGMVLSSLEIRSIHAMPDGWVVHAGPRPIGSVMTYQAAIVLPFDDLWTGLIRRESGGIANCRTTLGAADLANFILTLNPGPAPGDGGRVRDCAIPQFLLTNGQPLSGRSASRWPQAVALTDQGIGRLGPTACRPIGWSGD